MPQSLPQTPPEQQAPESSHWTAFSPNTDENLDFDTAMRRMNSSNQAAFQNISRDILKAAGIQKYNIHNSIGDWQDGAENSLFHTIEDPMSPQMAEYVAAWHGLFGHQKSILSFHSREAGPDSLYQIYLPNIQIPEVRDNLTRHGIQYRTLVPSAQGTTVLIYDGGRALRPNVAQFAEHYNAPIREAIGTGQFIGDTSGNPSRAKARHIFRDITHRYESQVREGTAPPPDVPDGGNEAPRPELKQFAALDQLPQPQAPQASPPLRRGPAVVRGISYKGGQVLPKPDPQPTLQATTPQTSTQRGAQQPSLYDDLPQPAEPKVPATPKTTRVQKASTELQNNLRTASDLLADHLALSGNPEVTEGLKNQFLQHSHQIWNRFTPVGMALYNQGVSGYRFYPSFEALSGVFHAIGHLPPGAITLGAYKPNTRTLYLSHPHDASSPYSVYAHEFYHAIDGPQSKISSLDSWDRAWRKELRAGYPSAYAGVHPAEGFAEFGRLLHHIGNSPQLHKLMSEMYPLSTKFMESTQLWKKLP